MGCLADIWRYIKERSIQPPEKPDKILEQLAKARLLPECLRLFSPWGPRYNGDSPRIVETDPEIATLREVRDIFKKLEDSGYRIDFLLMPADAYGTEVNNLPQDFVQEYFSWLAEWVYRELGETKISVRPWSSIRDGQSDLYGKLRVDADKNFFMRVRNGEYSRAVNVARVFNPGRPEESARRYCIERVVEAEIINRVYDPVKLSIVRKEKDSLDGPLKRVYIVQKRAPWLGGE